jgi:YHS domain-containing protein
MSWLSKLFGNGAKTKEATMKMEPSGMDEPKRSGEANTVRDPVCGMDVDPMTAAAKSEYMGKTYYFCAPGCKKAFVANPEKYAGGVGHEMAGHGGHKMQ